MSDQSFSVNNRIPAKRITSFLMTFSKWIGIIVGIFIALLTVWEKYQDIIDKNKRTEFIMEKMIDDYNRRICRLEKYLDKAFDMGAFEELKENRDIKLMEYKINILSDPEYVSDFIEELPEMKIETMYKEPEMISELKKSYNKIKDEDKPKTLDDYKKEYKQVQQQASDKSIVE